MDHIAYLRSLRCFRSSVWQPSVSFGSFFSGLIGQEDDVFSAHGSNMMVVVDRFMPYRNSKLLAFLSNEMTDAGN